MSGQLLDNESDLSADNNKDLYKLFEIKSQWTGHPLYFFHIHICSPILAVTYIYSRFTDFLFCKNSKILIINVALTDCCPIRHSLKQWFLTSLPNAQQDSKMT